MMARLQSCLRLQGISQGPRPLASKPRLSVARSGKNNGSSGINEDVLARLKAAEEEAARLRRELTAAQQSKGGAVPDVVSEVKPKRVDSTDNRETMFNVGGKKERAAWLSEADVDFFTGGAPGEATSEPVDPEMQGAVQKRLVIGGVLALGLAAFGLIPTEQLRLKPSKPMYFYVVPLLRIKDLLTECKPIIEDADWSTLRIVLPRVSGQPNNARENLENVVALLDDSRTAERAQKLSAEFFEYLDSIDYNKYFDAMPTRTLSGLQNAQYSEFSGKALKAALGKLNEFLALVPASALADAQAQQAF